MAEPEIRALLIVNSLPNLRFRLKKGQAVIGEMGILDLDGTVMVEDVSDHHDINNGSLAPASLAVAEFMRSHNPNFQTFFGLENDLVLIT